MVFEITRGEGGKLVFWGRWIDGGRRAKVKQTAFSRALFFFFVVDLVFLI